ncbi:E3 ubiquitin-protein ligase RGLG2 [Camellia lanceoleosa]|uniref:E3 ubiquitin-protein ligase RGLG2 n=1 Tax=Camellia lanceoleosa TaxID=1840588 RepID=A0ACC0HZT4_9ERIC|nr:E3 ubiquitin-protein ligase RGLG2 [Camellia lanceoleosa]
MGGKSSKRASTGRYSSFESDSYSWGPQGYPAQPSQTYMPPSQTYMPPPPPQSYGVRAPESKRKLERKYSRIDDDYNNVDEVTEALARAGLESSNLIVGIDFTKSNEWTASTHDQEVFSFYPDERFCDGFEEVLTRYKELVPQLRLAGPTSFAPIIEMAITIVEQSGGQYHVLVIIADGQVTRSVGTGHGQLSPRKKNFGVGDGPWDMMREFDDNIPARVFDNFQFVNFTEIMSKNVDRSRKEAAFALAALMEIPSQYKATLELQLLGAHRGKDIDRVPLPPPRYGSSSFGTPKHSRPTSFRPTAPSADGHNVAVGTSRPASSTSDNNVCPICLTDPKNMAFGCGHQTCCDCGEDLELCPICRSTIQTRIKLY